MGYKLLKDTTDQEERITGIVVTGLVIEEEITRGLSPKEYPELFRRATMAASLILNAIQSGVVPDDIYRRLDETLHEVLVESRLALLDTELLSTRTKLKDLESDFCDFSTLVESGERRAIALLLAECDNLISGARNFAREGQHEEKSKRLQQLSPKVVSLESMIDAAKTSAFNRAASIAFVSFVLPFAIPVILALYKADETIVKATPYLLVYFTAIAMVAIRNGLWTKTITSVKRAENSSRFTVVAILLLTLVGLPSMTRGGPYELTPEMRYYSIPVTYGLALGYLVSAVVIRIVKHGSKLKRHTFG